MSDVPVTDCEMLARWEWFRRSGWGDDKRQEMLRAAFVEVCDEIGANSCLCPDCGFGLDALDIYAKGICTTGCDESEYIINRAREYGHSCGGGVNFFTSTVAQLPEEVAHQYDAVYYPSLMLQPQWEKLREHFCAVFNVLRPGGCLAFGGPVEGRDWSSLLEAFDKRAEYEPLWSYREGGVSCSKVLAKGLRESNFADEVLLHMVTENDTPKIEKTVRRLPAYWSWQIIQDLCSQAGFCHVETRRFPGFEGRGQVCLNFAWKEGQLEQPQEIRSEEKSYADF